MTLNREEILREVRPWWKVLAERFCERNEALKLDSIEKNWATEIVWETGEQHGQWMKVVRSAGANK